MEIVADSTMEYHDLMEEDKQSLVDKLQAHQESKSKGQVHECEVTQTGYKTPCILWPSR